MSRIVMYVLNDVTLDSRVRREAATLAANGHEVTVMSTPRDRKAESVEVEDVDGYRIIRVPIPRTWQDRWRWIVQPWGLRRAGIGELHRALLDPRAWRCVPGAAGRAGLGLALTGARRASRGIARLVGSRDPDTGEPAYPPAGVRWLIWWRYGILGWAGAVAALAPRADAHHGHDLTGLSAASRAAHRDAAALIYDSHEIYLDSGANAVQPRWARKIMGRLERRWSAPAAALVTVNHAYADVLRRRLRPRRTVVVHNCPPRWRPGPADGKSLREAAAVPTGASLVLYHGALVAHRGIEELAEALLEPELADAHLVLLGYGGLSSRYRELAAESRFEGRMHVLPAVPPDELLAWVHGADVDAIPLERTTLNHFLCTPNKLFESLAAGVPVVVSDFPVMRSIVLDDAAGALGGVCDPVSPRSIARAIAAILSLDAAGREVLRGRCLEAAHERWNWELESVPLLGLYAELTSAR